MSLNYANSTVSTKNNVPVINWALFNNRANTDSAIPSEPAVGQCVFAKYYSSLNAGTPSFLLIPSRFKSGELYAQIPTNGNGDLNVTRSLNGATRVNSSGLIESVASGIPRFDYFASGGTVGCPALLVEPSGTNLALQSTFLTGWSTSLSGSVSGNASGTNSPEGSGNAALLSVVATAFSSISRTITTVSGSVYTASVFAKKRDKNFLYFVNLAGNTAIAWFNLASGTVGTVGANTTARIENYGNGWYRCSITQTAGGTTSYIQFGLSDADNTNAAASSGSNFVFGAQFELGSVATSYIPTTTAEVTRNADVVSVSGAVSGSIGQTEGSIYAEVNIQKLLGTTQRAIIDIGQSGNRLFLGYGNGLNNQIRFLLATSGGGIVDFESSTTTTGTIKISVGYKDNDSVMYINGASVSSISNGTFTTTLTNLSNIYTGSSLSGTDFLNDKIVEISLFNTRLSNTSLQNMTL